MRARVAKGDAPLLAAHAWAFGLSMTQAQAIAILREHGYHAFEVDGGIAERCNCYLTIRSLNATLGDSCDPSGLSCA